MINLNYMNMLSNTICELFENLVGKWSGCHPENVIGPPYKALLIYFRTKSTHYKMLIHAPANYVGVYVSQTKNRNEKDNYKCLCYHDSCWRTAVEEFLWKQRDEITGFLFFTDTELSEVQSLTEGIKIISLTEEQLSDLKRIRNEKYK